ncbi:class I SAM-dependent DNA methyltransferase [Nocardia stercoris]|uniref:Class I SAM-dependent methyltransferase n=1 Tax=Nocardia stercoris TaxID=2483361 RepID=A0A3M2LFC9_9NOCA|nr:class I SAM-dependent methyltransferase [Nocardia stercoris]RMI33388.1 class I SAM-dependent methyltransferase [Nocardia stercoris]
MRLIPQLPAALHWDHNAHYHALLLRALPERMDRALDVGCGTGVFARKLAARAGAVDGIDRSAAMIDLARAEGGTVRWVHGDVMDSVDLAPDGYDAVTAISSLHHMPLRPALARLGSLVRPGGTLAVIGIPRVTGREVPWEAISLPANAVMGVLRAAQGRAGKWQDIGMPMLDPTTTTADVRSAARDLLPSAVVRRHLFWRYSLIWHKPA